MTQDEINAVKKAAEKMRNQESAQDEIIEMAREAGIIHPEMVAKHLEAFAHLVAAKDYERGFIDGMQKQMQSSVDKAVNRMAQRTWVGLTEEDKKQMSKEANYHWEMTAGEYAERIGQLTEAKLKEKNGA